MRDGPSSESRQVSVCRELSEWSPLRKMWSKWPYTKPMPSLKSPVCRSSHDNHQKSGILVTASTVKKVKLAIVTGAARPSLRGRWTSELKPGRRNASKPNMSGSAMISTSGANASSALSTAAKAVGSISGSQPPARSPNMRKSTNCSSSLAGRGSGCRAAGDDMIGPPAGKPGRTTSTGWPCAAKCAQCPIAAIAAPSSFGHHAFTT